MKNKDALNAELIEEVSKKISDLNKIKRLLNGGADAGVKGGIFEQTILHVAAQSGSVALVKYLVEKGADIREVNGSGESVLYKTAQSGSLNLVRYLVRKGADIREVNGSGESVLYKAAQSGSVALVKYLVEKGADIREVTSEGESLLSAAAQSGSVALVKYLVEKGADINKVDNGGKNAMSYFIYNPEMQKYLFEHGAIPLPKAQDQLSKVQDQQLKQLAQDNQSVHTSSAVEKNNFYFKELVKNTKITNDTTQLLAESEKLINKFKNLKFDDLTIKLLEISGQEQQDVIKTVTDKTQYLENDTAFVSRVIDNSKVVLEQKLLRKNDIGQFDVGYPSYSYRYDLQDSTKQITISQSLIAIAKLIDNKESTKEEIQELCVTALATLAKSNISNDKQNEIAKLLNIDISKLHFDNRGKCHDLLNNTTKEQISDIFKVVTNGIDINKEIKKKDYFSLAKQIFVVNNTYGDNKTACMQGALSQIIAAINDIEPKYLDNYTAHKEEINKKACLANTINPENAGNVIEVIMFNIIELASSKDTTKETKEAIADLGSNMLDINKPNDITKAQQRVLTTVNKGLLQGITNLPNYAQNLIPTLEEYKIIVNIISENPQMQQLSQKLAGEAASQDFLPPRSLSSTLSTSHAAKLNNSRKSGVQENSR